MQEETVTLDKSTFKALASETRIAILKALDARRKTASELAGELKATVQGISEHLASLQQAGLVERRESGRKWVYYELTDTGSAVLHPDTKKFWVLVGLSLIAFAIGGQTLLAQIYSQQALAVSSGETLPPAQREITQAPQPTVIPQPQAVAGAGDASEIGGAPTIISKAAVEETIRTVEPIASPQIARAVPATAKPISESEAALLFAGALLLLASGWLKFVKKTA